MKFTIVATALALASTALSAPGKCVSISEAQAIVNRYVGIQTQAGSDFGNATETAEKLLVKNYEEISDSILSLEKAPVCASREKMYRIANTNISASSAPPPQPPVMRSSRWC